MKLFEINIIDELKNRKKFPYGVITKVTYKDGNIKSGERMLWVPDVQKKREEVSEVTIDIQYQSKNIVYPDFFNIRFGNMCGDEKTFTFLEKNHIMHYSIQTKIVEKIPVEYTFLDFPLTDKNYINLEKSDVTLNEEGRVVTPGQKTLWPTSKIFLKRDILQVRGIYRLRDYSVMLICDEETKNRLESEHLSGIDLEDITNKIVY